MEYMRKIADIYRRSITLLNKIPPKNLTISLDNIETNY